LDGGAYVFDVTLEVNGEVIEPNPDAEYEFRRSFACDRDGILLPRTLPLRCSQSGFTPVCVQFSLAREKWQFARSKKPLDAGMPVTSIRAICRVAGNYRISVLTGEQDIAGYYDEEQRFEEPYREAFVVEESGEVEGPRCLDLRDLYVNENDFSRFDDSITSGSTLAKVEFDWYTSDQ
jgi:hypothetical protein